MGEVVDVRVSVPTSMLGADEIRLWAYRCVDSLTDRCDEINDLNVFPIADSDTGTNLVFTVRSAVESMRAAGSDAKLAEVTAALARGAVAGARGNSGLIVSQLMRALAEESIKGVLDGEGLQHALHRASELVVGVVSVPVEGTIVTVLGAAASAAASAGPGASVSEIVEIANATAALALDRTRAQLPALKAAGVVDAGALGLLLMLDALTSVVTGEMPVRPRYHRHVVSSSKPPKLVRAPRPESDPVVGYEVVFRVTDIDASKVKALRDTLADLGDSVVVAGDGAGTWSAHVHTVNAGLAVERGIDAGRVHGIRISAFTAGQNCDGGTAVSNSRHDHRFGRDVLAVVAGDGAESLFVAEGATVLRCDTDAIGPSDLCASIVRSEHAEVLVLPNGALSAQELVSVSIASRTAGKDVLMLPSSSMVQGLAALAVHDPSREAVDDAFAMSEAAAGTRWASLRIAAERSLTWVGTCEPGDGLGLVGHEVVVIGSDAVAAGSDLLEKLLSGGGEMVTMLRGASQPDVTTELAAYVAQRYPAVEVLVYDGGQPDDVLQLGVE